MPKINPDMDWSCNLDFNYNVKVEFIKNSNDNNNIFNQYVFSNEVGLSIITPLQNQQQKTDGEAKVAESSDKMENVMTYPFNLIMNEAGMNLLKRLSQQSNQSNDYNYMDYTDGNNL